MATRHVHHRAWRLLSAGPVRSDHLDAGVAGLRLSRGVDALGIVRLLLRGACHPDFRRGIVLTPQQRSDPLGVPVGSRRCGRRLVDADIVQMGCVECGRHARRTPDFRGTAERRSEFGGSCHGLLRHSQGMPTGLRGSTSSLHFLPFAPVDRRGASLAPGGVSDPAGQRGRPAWSPP